MAISALTPGDHTFKTTKSSIKTLSYSIIPSSKPSVTLIVIQAVGWEPGQTFYTRSLAPVSTDYYAVTTFSPRASDQSARSKDAEGNDDMSQMSSTSFAEDLESLRTYFDIPSFPLLMSHFNAGYIAVAYAGLYSTRVEKLVMIGSQLLSWDNSATFKRFAVERATQKPWKKAYEVWSDGYPSIDEESREFLSGMFPSYFVDPDTDCPTIFEHMKGSPLSI